MRIVKPTELLHISGGAATGPIVDPAQDAQRIVEEIVKQGMDTSPGPTVPPSPAPSPID